MDEPWRLEQIHRYIDSQWLCCSTLYNRERQQEAGHNQMIDNSLMAAVELYSMPLIFDCFGPPKYSQGTYTRHRTRAFFTSGEHPPCFEIDYVLVVCTQYTLSLRSITDFPPTTENQYGRAAFAAIFSVVHSRAMIHNGIRMRSRSVFSNLASPAVRSSAKRLASRLFPYSGAFIVVASSCAGHHAEC